MKKKVVSKAVQNSNKGDKSLFRKAGEVVGAIGAQIVHSKDSVAEFVSEEVGVVKNAFRKQIKKKAAQKKTKRMIRPKATKKKLAKAARGAVKISRKNSTKKPNA